MKNDYDFSGWATVNDIKCSDGRVIRKDAFAHNDGQIVPLVWQHQHNDVFNILGRALLKKEDKGMRAFGYFNDTEAGQNAKMLLQHGDIVSLSIYATKLQQNGTDVMHGDIKEVSLVLAPANPSASIDFVSFAHGEVVESEGAIYTGEPVSLYHADKDDDAEDKKEEPEEKKKESDETVGDVFNTLNDKQKKAVYALFGAAFENEEKKDDSEGGDKDMKHNAFDRSDVNSRNVLAHADQETILNMAKNSNIGTFQNALSLYAEQNDLVLVHDEDSASSTIASAGGFYQPSEAGNVTLLFPEYKDVRPGAPELITNDQGWISTVMNKVHKSPISRIRTGQVDIRNIDALRAKGYVKGTQKSLSGNFRLVRRTTDPQTIYVKNALHRDDIVDITDFDYVQYLFNIDKMMLNEELATAIMLGDGREDEDNDKISSEHIRPIWTDDDLYTLHKDIDLESAREELQGTDTDTYFGDNYITAEAMINTVLYAREDFKGSGTPDMYITPHMLNVMLLARDRNGRRIYSSKAELASALNVGEIYTCEQFANKTRTSGTGADTKTKKLIALIVNLADYSLGATKGGEVTHFTQFDIDFNQEKSLLETRVSGALTRVYSAIAIEEDVTASGVTGASGATGATGTTGA